ncbi:MAG: glycosyltransferase family 1 protein [Bacteroidales bacterium]|nr:glycosyltransferase family 1 protein [Bacteroidales bacterium]
MITHLHIVSFDIPYPPNYGGIIDVFYKIKALHTAGIKIHLHCFEYDRKPAPQLDFYCESIDYYPRRTGFSANLALTPYIVASRQSEKLLQNLLQDDHPIIFEGLHTCGFLSDNRLQNRLLIYRESNIEHHYYYYLSKAEKNWGKKMFFLVESLRLKVFQQTLQHASVMLTVSEEDTRYLATHFPGRKVVYLPSFHGNDRVTARPGKGTYALYQGKLSVPENTVAAEFLITKVWEDSFPELILAGLNPPEHLVKLAGQRSNIRVVVSPGEEEMNDLVANAHINILVTFQATGLKLKLLNALFNGRFCLVNPAIVHGTQLGELCTIANTSLEFKNEISTLFSKEFSESLIQQRKDALIERYSNQNNCKLFLNILNLS